MNDELKRHGVETYLTRTKDENDPLRDEIAEINKYGPDIAIDVHTNAGGGDGFEAYYSKATNGLGKRLAELLEVEIKAIGQNSRGIKTKLNSSGKDYYGFIRETNCPAVIVEGAFIDSADIKIMDTIEEQKAVGVAYARGLLNYLGISGGEIGPDYKTLYEKEKAITDRIKEILK
jgi:N-acetylmuramoyl-L-alanine amidase